MFLKKLQALLTENNDKQIFPCIEDLVSNGLKLDRFAITDHTPSRQDITQQLAAWFKYIGVSSDDCSEWMTEYCISMLSSISSSSASRIRHSTKSNIKYIYKSDSLFVCGCAKNKFKASCDEKCSIYEEMEQRAQKTKTENGVDVFETKLKSKINDESVALSFSIKDKYKKQFEEAMLIAHQHLTKNIKKKEIVNILNNNGFKTRTGKKWTYSILIRELGQLNKIAGD